MEAAAAGKRIDAGASTRPAAAAGAGAGQVLKRPAAATGEAGLVLKRPAAAAGAGAGQVLKRPAAAEVLKHPAAAKAPAAEPDYHRIRQTAYTTAYKRARRDGRTAIEQKEIAKQAGADAVEAARAAFE